MAALLQYMAVFSPSWWCTLQWPEEKLLALLQSTLLRLQPTEVKIFWKTTLSLIPIKSVLISNQTTTFITFKTRVKNITGVKPADVIPASAFENQFLCPIKVETHCITAARDNHQQDGSVNTSPAVELRCQLRCPLSLTVHLFGSDVVSLVLLLSLRIISGKSTLNLAECPNEN